MNTFIEILHKINWVDVAMLGLLIRIVFIGVKTGFVTELFKLLGVLIASLVSLHYYTALAGWVVQKTNWSLEILECVFFVILTCLAVLLVKFLRDGFLLIFKFETTHAGVNQWGSGLFSIIRALFLASFILFGILLSRVDWLQKETRTSISHRLALRVAPSTYSFLYNNLIGKIFIKERFNQEVNNVVSNKLK